MLSLFVVLPLVRHNICFTVLPAVAFFGGFEFAPASEFDYVVRAEIQNPGYILRSDQIDRKMPPVSLA